MTSAGTIATMTEKALVLVSYGNRGIAELDDGSRIRCEYRRSVGRPYCGDHVLVEIAAGQTSMVTEILPRMNEFARADAHQRKQVIAANLDQVLIVIAPEPGPSKDLLERYLVAVHSLGTTPVIVVNKAELLEQETTEREGAFSRLEKYRELGYQVVAVSCMGEPGTKPLPAMLKDKTSILVGQSGVGKSSLANVLIPDLDLQTGALSRVTGKGVHTTTTTIMYSLHSGGKLIDSPGVWEYGLWEMDASELENGFREFAPALGHCKFRNCRHAGEPGCAVANAVSEGEIMEWRYQSYRRLLTQAG